MDVIQGIWKTCRTRDRSGEYYCVLTEKPDSLARNNEGKYHTLHYTIRAINLKIDSGKLKKVWEINDYAIRDPKLAMNKANQSIFEKMSF